MNQSFFPYTTASDSSTVTAASAVFTQTLAQNDYYLFISSTNCWLKQGTTPTASAADGSMFWPANTPLIIDGGLGVTLAVIRATADGTASLTKCR